MLLNGPLLIFTPRLGVIPAREERTPSGGDSLHLSARGQHARAMSEGSPTMSAPAEDLEIGTQRSLTGGRCWKMRKTRGK